MTKKKAYRYPVTLRLTPLIGFALTDLLAATPLSVVADSRGVGVALVAKLLAAGLEAELLDYAAAMARPCKAVIYLEGLAIDNSDTEAITLNYRAFALARHTIQSYQLSQSHTRAPAGLLICAYQSEQPYLAGLAALIKTADKEWSGVGLKSIAFEASLDAETTAALLFAELTAGGDELEVVYNAERQRTCYQSPLMPLPQ
ncbi:hypothetical protein D5085_00090 [Ectothiorhodospiraceae bacterium BW-2]|nr:hypothetical protein D5085_00090 [Ectothiorhodospiraceae bacterium BW-2]